MEPLEERVAALEAKVEALVDRIERHQPRVLVPGRAGAMTRDDLIRQLKWQTDTQVPPPPEAA